MITPVVTFQQAFDKKLLHNADVLLFKSPKFPSLGYWIGLYSASEYSHAGTIYLNGGEKNIFIVEAREFKGVRVIPVNYYLELGYEIDVFRHPRMVEYKNKIVNFDKKMELDIIQLAISKGGREYGWSIIWDFIKSFTPFIRWWSDKSGDDKEPKQFVCSTLISFCYRKAAGIDLCPYLADSYVSPGDLARSGLLEKVFTLKGIQ